MRRIKLLWPWRVRVRLPESATQSTDYWGRRYGDYFWLAISFGHVHVNVFPKHVRGVWTSIEWRDPRGHS